MRKLAAVLTFMILLCVGADELQHPVLTHRIFAGADCSGNYVDVLMEANRCVKYAFPRCQTHDGEEVYCAGGNIMPNESVYMKGLCDANSAAGAQYTDEECTELMPHISGESVTEVRQYPSECLSGFTRLMSCSTQEMLSPRGHSYKGAPAREAPATCEVQGQAEAAKLSAELSAELLAARTAEAEALGKVSGLEGQVRILTTQNEWLQSLIMRMLPPNASSS